MVTGSWHVRYCAGHDLFDPLCAPPFATRLQSVTIAGQVRITTGWAGEVEQFQTGPIQTMHRDEGHTYASGPCCIELYCFTLPLGLFLNGFYVRSYGIAVFRVCWFIHSFGDVGGVQASPRNRGPWKKARLGTRPKQCILWKLVARRDGNTLEHSDVTRITKGCNTKQSSAANACF